MTNDRVSSPVINMSHDPDPFEAAASALEREAQEYEGKANEARQLALALRSRRPAVVTSSLRIAEKPVIQPARVAAPSAVAQRRPQKGETTELVLRAIRESPGRTSSEIAQALAGTLTHIPEVPKRAKLIHSTLGYLRDRAKTVRRDARGGYYMNE